MFPRPSASSVGRLTDHVPADIAERVAAFVSVRSGVGQLADADAVEDDDE